MRWLWTAGQRMGKSPPAHKQWRVPARQTCGSYSAESANSGALTTHSTRIVHSGFDSLENPADSFIAALSGLQGQAEHRVEGQACDQTFRMLTSLPRSLQAIDRTHCESKQRASAHKGFQHSTDGQPFWLLLLQCPSPLVQRHGLSVYPAGRGSAAAWRTGWPQQC